MVILDDSGGTPSVQGVHDFPTDNADLATQLYDVAEAVRSALRGVQVDRVLLRRADRPPRASNTDGPRLRLLAEGALVHAARSVVVDTRVGTGKDTGAWHGTSKATLDVASRQLLSQGNLHDRYMEAASAALAALALP
jgi:hypothetical protein